MGAQTGILIGNVYDLVLVSTSMLLLICAHDLLDPALFLRCLERIALSLQVLQFATESVKTR
jgi:hypothetical protein